MDIQTDITRTGRRHWWARLGREEGMSTVEYAIGLLAAAGFAGLLAVILASPEVRGFLTSIVHDALNH